MAATSLFRRLYRGESNADFIGSRKRWYIASAIIIAICVASMIFRGFHFSIDFVGGDQYQLPVKPGVTISDVRNAVSGTGADVASAVTAGSGGSQSFIVQTSHNASESASIVAALTKAGHTPDITYSQISGTWGGEITKQAAYGLIAFLILVSAFISVRFRDWRMAVAALGALGHDLILTAGVYSIVGFLVAPSTVVGLLTILGFSLYDTVVVFDKVDENTRGLLTTSRNTYAEAANLAVNQTLMRSINTSIIGLLPVAGLLFVGAGILGVGTLEDLALVLFVGMLTGAYSSLFLATPWLVDLKMTDSRYKNHAARVLNRRAGIQAKRQEAAQAKASGAEAAAGEPADAVSADAKPADGDAEDEYAGSGAPRVGAKPVRPSAPRRSSGARPANRPSAGGGKRRG